MNIEEILDDLRAEPPWRWTANREAAYRDCNQLDAEVLHAMEVAGMLPITVPLIGAIIDSVLGVEALTRRDGVVLANEEKDSDEAKALSVRLKQIEQRSGADTAISGGYDGQIGVGVGWAEVGINPNPFGYRHKCSNPHRRELWWDWRGGADPDEWRYMVRRKWYDADLLARMFPAKRKLIEQAGRGFPEWANGACDLGPGNDFNDEPLLRSAQQWELERDSSFADSEWRETVRRRLCLFEVWYRQYDAGKVLRIPEHDIVMEFDPENPRHVALVEAGIARMETAILPRMRLAWWVGPHQLADIPSPYHHEEFPYVPFLGFQEDRTGMWYGLIRRMMSGQDQINSDATILHYLMTSTLVMGDEDAFADPIDDVEARIGQKNVLIALNPDRKNRGDKPQVLTDRALAAQHFSVFQEAKQTLGANAGIRDAYQGTGEAQQSGVALNTLVERSTTGLAKINIRYAWARHKVLDILLANEIAHMSGRAFSQVIEENRQPKQIYFNRREGQDANGDDLLTNDLDRMRTRVELADAPATTTFKQQLFQGLLSLTESLPDDMKRALVPMLVRAGDYPDREDVAALLERSLGMGAEQTPADVLNKQRAAALEAQASQLALEQGQAKTRAEVAKADKLEAEIEQLRVQVQAMIAANQRAEQDRAMALALGSGEMQMIPPTLPTAGPPP
jgi:hypothetical protein